MKHYAVLLYPDAIRDLEDIYDYIFAKSGYEQRAWRYIEKIRQQCVALEVAPQRGLIRNDLMKGLRILALDHRSVAAFLIKEKAGEVHILNVFYGGQDYEALFGVGRKG